MNRIINILISLSVSLLLLAACGKKNQKKEMEIIKPVKFEKITYASGDMVRSFLGTARSNKEINLSFRTSGILTTLNIAVGQKVNEGDLLAQLDNTEAILSLEQAVASLNSAKSNLNTASSSLERTRTLFEKGSASLSDYENSKSSFANAKANYQSAERTVDIRKKQVSYGVIYAPANGVIASRNVEINENVNAGQLVSTLNAGNKMEVSLGIPENMINRIQQNMKVKIQFPALKSKNFTGYVNEISPSVDVNTSTYPVRIRIEKASKEIKSGMAADVTFSFDEKIKQEALIVPITAVGEDRKGNFVFLIQSEDGKTGTVRKQHFTIGELTANGFIVKKGLKPGQKVATAGLQTLLDGQKVRLQ
ncbi:MAG: efflux RND transporter periplasmic adaptor subunit [Marinifilaceae bacterium]